MKSEDLVDIQKRCLYIGFGEVCTSFYGNFPDEHSDAPSEALALVSRHVLAYHPLKTYQHESEPAREQNKRLCSDRRLKKKKRTQNMECLILNIIPIQHRAPKIAHILFPYTFSTYNFHFVQNFRFVLVGVSRCFTVPRPCKVRKVPHKRFALRLC